MREILYREDTGKTLKWLFQLLVSTTYIGIIMETGTCPAEQKIQYATMRLQHNMKNIDDNKKVKKVVEELAQNQYNNAFNQKVQKTCKLILVMFFYQYQNGNIRYKGKQQTK